MKEEALLYNFLIFQVKPVGFSTFSLLGCRASQGLFPQPLSMSSIQFGCTISQGVTRVNPGKGDRCEKTSLRIKHDIRTAGVGIDVDFRIHTEQIPDLLRHEHLLRRAEIYDPARLHQDDLVAVAGGDVQFVDG